MNKRLVIFGWLSFFIITLFSLYPNPLLLPLTIYRVFSPPIDSSSEGIQKLAMQTFKKDPAMIEEAVKDKFHYRLDWEVYHLPWYFPTVEEALEKGEGDCKMIALIVASIFEYREVAYSFKASPTHVWIDYEGKEKPSHERDEVAFASIGEGGLTVSSPQTIHWQSSSRVSWQAFWDYMPLEKKISLFLGFLFSAPFIFAPGHVKKFFDSRS